MAGREMNASDSNKTVSGCVSVICLFTFEVRVAFTLFFTLVFLLSFVGNCVFFTVILRHKRLRRSSTNFSILSLSFANILITLFCIPFFVLNIFIMGKWVFGLIACKLVIFVQNLATNAAIFTLVIISVEKFLVVHFPFHVRSQRTKVRYLVLSGWIMGMIQSSVYLSYRTVRKYRGIPLCVEDWPSFRTRQIFLVVQAIALRFVPLTLMICLHIVTILKIKARLRYRRATEEDEMGPMSAMVQVNPQALRIRKKAVVMLVTIVVVSAWTLFPYNGFVCWRMLGNTESLSNPFASNITYIVTMWLVFLNSGCHPIIFGLMCAEYRDAAKRTLSWKSPASNRSRSSTRKQNREEPIILTVQGGNCPSGSS